MKLTCPIDKVLSLKSVSVIMPVGVEIHFHVQFEQMVSQTQGHSTVSHKLYLLLASLLKREQNLCHHTFTQCVDTTYSDLSKSQGINHLYIVMLCANR